VQAVGSEFLGRDVIANGAGPRGLAQQVGDHFPDLLLRPADLLVPVQERC